ncbi:negative transcriptional regulator, PaiB family [Bryocella elongata]|uniref:Negative transcriptional regulator, PaiB family n=1 Tax=Bryocella elongata TaxID=863522 RepID=A0A1H5ZPQ5_9BACT|nr:FMN-binding negative transcriptional regulator [Bryocella elongata]SEG37376.1 negative transcriptional regulator, PaiB family [Bryocella elongata]
MYIPKFNAEHNIPEMHALLRAHPLATLVTMHPSGLFASHIPMVIHSEESENGVLRGHLARANAQWEDFDASVEALAIFTGHDHYISPSWYPSKAENHRSVPTWNYSVVHAYGTLRVIEDASWLRAHLAALTHQHEQQFAAPWTLEDAAPDYIDALIRGIVGLEITITRLEGKRKLSQNRDERDRNGVIAGLDAMATPESHAISEEMRKA